MFKSEGQIYIFAAFVFCGVATGLWHWLSHLCCPCGAKKWKIFVCDAVFAAGFAFLLFAFFYFVHGIQLRWYCFLGLGLGFFAYAKILGEPLDFLKAWIYNKWDKIKGVYKCRKKETRKKSSS